MGIFSEELAILDKNTVDYMIDEMQNTIDEQKETIDAQQGTIDAQQGTIDVQREAIGDLEGRLEMQRLYQENLNQLIQKLIEDNRTEELIRSTVDKDFQERLLKEYGFL